MFSFPEVLLLQCCMLFSFLYSLGCAKESLEVPVLFVTFRKMLAKFPVWRPPLLSCPPIPLSASWVHAMPRWRDPFHANRSYCHFGGSWPFTVKHISKSASVLQAGLCSLNRCPNLGDCFSIELHVRVGVWLLDQPDGQYYIPSCVK
jgi:hypothetical protein